MVISAKDATIGTVVSGHCGCEFEVLGVERMAVGHYNPQCLLRRIYRCGNKSDVCPYDGFGYDLIRVGPKHPLLFDPLANALQAAFGTKEKAED